MRRHACGSYPDVSSIVPRRAVQSIAHPRIHPFRPITKSIDMAAPHGTLSEAVRDYVAANPGTAPTAIVTALHGQGVKVSRSLVNKVLYGGKPKGRRGGRRRAAAAGTSGATTGTQAIQEYIRRHPAAGPKQIREGLGEQGVTVSASLISAVKYRKGSAKPAVRAAARRKPSRQGGSKSVGLTLAQLLEVK